MVRTITHWINGESVEPHGGGYLPGLNPANGQEGPSVARGQASDVAAAVAAAKAAAPGWRHFKTASRGRLLYELAGAIRQNAEHLADIESEDTGKPRKQALGEIESSAAYFEFYAGLVNLPAGETLNVEPGQHVYTIQEPFGVVGIITPWNGPLNQAARACAPALAAANTVVIKPAEVATQSTVRLAQLATEVGFPPGVFNVVLGKGTEAGSALVEHGDVRKIAFTGSVATGRAIGHIAADRIIPLSLELGGKSANIVFDDADLDFAASEAVRAFTSNAGQVCSAGTRLLVQRSIYEAFVAKVAELSGNVIPGSDYGPMITREQFAQVKSYFEVAAAEGLVPLTGGSAVDQGELAKGFYVNPTIYKDVKNSQRMAQEEIFGPVLVAMPFDSEEEAITISNDSEFGLVAGVWTQNVSRAIRVAESIEAGQVFVNTWSTGAVEAPFGGHKNSGYGREKGIEALRHYTHVKCITIKL